MTPNKEDYLKCIYEIGTEEGKISNKEIANRMQVSPPAVTEMIKKLISEGLIIKDKAKGYLLTETGTINVAELYRKHRLIEAFLVDHLQYTCDQIHQEAEILEHTVSDHFIDALDRLLNYPQTCPHGGQIPKSGQLIEEIYNQTFTQGNFSPHARFWWPLAAALILLSYCPGEEWLKAFPLQAFQYGDGGNVRISFTAGSMPVFTENTGNIVHQFFVCQRTVTAYLVRITKTTG